MLQTRWLDPQSFWCGKDWSCCTWTEQICCDRSHVKVSVQAKVIFNVLFSTLTNIH